MTDNPVPDIREQRKQNKRNHIIDLFRKYGQLSKAEVKNHSGYAMSTVINAVDYLTDQGILHLIGTEKTDRRGRRSSYYALEETRCIYAGITFTRSGIYSILMSLSGKVLGRRDESIEKPLNRNQFIRRFSRHINALLSDHPELTGRIVRTGFALPGTINTQNGVLESYTLMPALDGTDFGRIARKHFPDMDIVFEHNVTGFLSWFIRDRDRIENTSRIYLVSLRSGPSLGEIYKGEIVMGRGELGHVQVTEKGPDCACGRRGCLDTYLSHSALSDALIRICSEENVPLGNKKQNDFLTIDRIIQLCQSPSKRIRREIENRFTLLAKALLDLINLGSPDLVILSGELFHCLNDPVKTLTSIISSQYNDTGYILNFSQTEIVFEDQSTAIAAEGIAERIMHKDFAYHAEKPFTGERE